MKTRSNKIKDIKDYVLEELKNKYSKTEINSLISILFEEYTGLNTAHILAFEQDYVNESELLKIVLATEQLKKEKPIQQILGYAEFCGLKIKVDENVLIPRPETEELCYKIVEQEKSNENKKLRIIDLCCGSACIALSLKKHLPQAEVFAMDVSSKALKIAQENINNLGLEIKLLQGDLLNGFNIEQDFDIIVSNPPYIMQKEKADMHNNVLKYEPSIALFVEDEKPLIFYEKISSFAQKHLSKQGRVYLEINENLGNKTLSLFSEKEYLGQVKKDIFNKDRFIFLKKKM